MRQRLVAAGTIVMTVAILAGMGRIADAGRDAVFQTVARSSKTLPTILTVGLLPVLTDVPRIGVNLSGWTTYGAEQFQSNIVMNPGFEPVIDRTMVIVQNPTSTGFSHHSTWPAYADNFWKNATFEVLSGQSAGVSGTMVSSQKAGAGGLPTFQTAAPAPKLAAGDAVALTQVEGSGGLIPGWWNPASSTGLVTINTGDHRPGSPGVSAGQLSLVGGQATELDYYWDSLPNTLPGGKFLLVTGAWQLSFWARASSGSPSLAVSFQRLSAGAPVWVAQSYPLGSAWQQYTVSFTASDSGAAGPLALKFVASGAGGSQVRLDDVALGRPSDTTAWRAELVGALQTLRPGYLRDWQNQLGDTAANRLASSFGRSPQRWLPDPANVLYQFLYGLPDFLGLCSQVGANPWVVLPPTLYSSELSALGSYLASAQSSYHFSEVVVEFGDENWNSVFDPAEIGNPVTMGQAANRAFATLSAAAGAAVPLHLVVNSQFVNPWVGQQAVLNAPLANAADVATYVYSTMNATDSPATILSAMFTMSDLPPLVSQLQADLPATLGVDVYEVNLGTIAGSAPESMRDPYVAGQGAGSALAARLLTALYAGVSRQAVFDLAQYNYNTGSSGTVALWGIMHDLTTSSSFRPTGLALEMLNQAVGGDFYPVTAVGPGAAGLTAAAFLNGSAWALAIASANSSPTPVAIVLPVLRTNAWSQFTLAAPTVTTTNETGNQVQIIKTSLSNLSQLTIPPYGFVVVVPS
jgi:hypothetical protein